MRQKKYLLMPPYSFIWHLRVVTIKLAILRPFLLIFLLTTWTCFSKMWYRGSLWGSFKVFKSELEQNGYFFQNSLGISWAFCMMNIWPQIRKIGQLYCIKNWSETELNLQYEIRICKSNHNEVMVKKTNYYSFRWISLYFLPSLYSTWVSTCMLFLQF